MSAGEIRFLSPVDEIIPESADSEDDATVGLACVTCGVPLTYRGSGRKPKYCDEHNPRKGGSKPAVTRGNKDERLRNELAASLTSIGLVVSMFEMYDGLVIMDRSEKTADALMLAASTNPRLRKALEQMLEVSAYASLATALAGLVVPIAAHHGLLPIPAEFVEAQFLSEKTIANIARLKPQSPTE